MAEKNHERIEMLNARYSMRLKEIVMGNGMHLINENERERARENGVLIKIYTGGKAHIHIHTLTQSPNPTFDLNRLNFLLVSVCADAIAHEQSSFTCNVLSSVHFSVRCIMLSFLLLLLMLVPV